MFDLCRVSTLFFFLIGCYMFTKQILDRFFSKQVYYVNDLHMCVEMISFFGTFEDSPNTPCLGYFPTSLGPLHQQIHIIFLGFNF